LSIQTKEQGTGGRLKACPPVPLFQISNHQLYNFHYSSLLSDLLPNKVVLITLMSAHSEHLSGQLAFLEGNESHPKSWKSEEVKKNTPY
jgi:hypothetical protein